MSLREGCEVVVRGWGGGCFPLENKGKGGGGGKVRRWVGDQQRYRQVNAHPFVKMPSSDLRFSSFFSDFRGLSQSNPKSNPESDFLKQPGLGIVNQNTQVKPGVSGTLPECYLAAVLGPRELLPR